MKKRNKLITFLSSIFGCVALCGAFALSSILDHKQKTEETKAESTVLINSYTGSIGYPIWESINIEGESYGFTGSYYVAVYRNLADTYKYTYTYNLTLNRITLIGDYYNGYYVELFDDNNQPFTSSLSLKTDLELPYVVSSLSYIQSNINDNLIRLTNILYSSSFRSQLGITSDNSVFVPSSNGLMYLITSIKVYDNSSIEIVDDSVIDEVLRKISNLPPNDSFYLTFQQVNVSTVNTESDQYANGYDVGYADGSQSGYNQGYNQGILDGKDEQYQDDLNLFDDYYQQGYSAGYTQGSSEDATVTSIFGGITSVALVPINFFLSIFNFEILGVNIASVVSALMSICLILIVWKAVMGGKSSD